MRKKGFIFLLILMLSFIKVSNINAEPETNTKNLIDLNNIYLVDRYYTSYRPADRYLKMKDYIDVEIGKNYTLVIHEDFLEQDFDYFDLSGDDYDLHLIYENSETQQIPTNIIYSHVYDTYGYIWCTFEALDSKVKIDQINSRISNSEDELPFKIMLFQGEIEDFRGFYSYKSNLMPEEGNLFVNIDELYELDEILDLFSISTSKGVNSSLEVIYDDYSEHNNEIGEYLIKLKAQDDFINVSFYDLKIHVLDLEPPKITGIDRMEVDFNDIKEITIENIKNELTVSDNYSNITLEDLEVIKDEYTNTDRLGIHEIVFKVVDSSLNEARHTVNINVVDKTPPVITGPLEIYRYTTDPVVTEPEIRALYTAHDDIDGDITGKILIHGTFKNTLGVHAIYISVYDSARNLTQKKLNLKVVEGIPPTFQTARLVLSANEYNEMTEEELIDWIKNNIGFEVSMVEIVSNELLYTDEGNIYYSFSVDGKTMYGIIEVQKSKFNTLKLFVLIGGVTIIVSSSLLIIIKRKYK